MAVAIVDLLNPRAKIVRGFAHYETLWEEVAAFAAVTPDPIVAWEQTTVVEDGQTWNALVCTEILQPPPVELGLIAGDSIHNLRTALDHLVCALIRANGKQPKRANQFPIQVTTPDKEAKKRIQRNLAGLASEARKRIRELQPFLDPSSERSRGLRLLAILDNADKHQLVTPAIAISDSPLIRVDPPHLSPRGIVSFRQYVPLFPGTTIFRWPIDSEIKSVSVDSLKVFVGFGSADEGITMSGFPHLGQVVFEIVESFEEVRPI